MVGSSAKNSSPRPKFAKRPISVVQRFAVPSASPSATLPSSKWNVLLEAYPGDTDYMTTGSYSEYQQYPGLGQNFYVPNNQSELGSAIAIYRLYNGSNDHMISPTPGEAGYGTEGILGYPLNSSTILPGLIEINRFYNNISDHATGAAGTGIGGYTDEGGWGLYGFMRYRTNRDELQAYSGGGITEKSDVIAGGAIASWVWNGIEFINTHDYGRYFQADFFFTDPTSASGYIYNPIEAGDEFYSDSDTLLYRHGSPCVLNEVTAGGHQTRAAPLDYWAPQIDTDINSVRIYHSAQIGKNLVLGWNGINQVAQYTTHLIVPVPVVCLETEVPTAYLNGQFSNFYTFDVANNQINQVLQGVDSCTSLSNELLFNPSSGYGGVIISTPDGSAAQGVYAVTNHAGSGSRISNFILDNFIPCYQTSKWAVRADGITLSAGDNTFTMYVVTGTLTDTQNLMRQLYSIGAI